MRRGGFTAARFQFQFARVADCNGKRKGTTMNTTEKLLAELNAVRGLKSPEAGFAFWGDVRGDGVCRPQVWVYTGRGGVTQSELNGRNARDRCQRIRAAIAAARQAACGVTLAHDPHRPWFPGA